MPRNLKNQADAQVTAFKAVVERAQAELAAAQDELTRRHPNPGGVAAADRRDEFGAEQYHAEATARRQALIAEEATIRGRSADATPEELDAVEDDLRENLAAQTRAAVELRDAEERREAAHRALARAGAYHAAATAILRSAEQWAGEADGRQKQHKDWRDSLGDPPLDAVVADATAALNGPDRNAARNRLTALLPASLWNRSGERHAEALAVVAAVAEAAGEEAAVLDDLWTDDAPVAGAVRAARRRLDTAEAALGAYVRSAPERLTAAVRALEGIRGVPGTPGVPDLTPEQADALDEADADNADAVAAVGFEAELATRLAAFQSEDRTVTLEILRALAADPDRNPAGVQDVIDAVGVRDDPATILTPLNDARGDYDWAAREALDEWEVEVPARLWAATREYHDAVATLTELADNATRTELVDALDDAVDALAGAMDDHAKRQRALLEVERRVNARTDEADVLARTSTDRVLAYVRGDGPGGRTPAEL